METRSLKLLSMCLILVLVAFSATACKRWKAKKDWAASGHADITSEAFIHWDEDGAIPTSCAGCHSTAGFIDFVADGSVDSEVTVPITDEALQGINCAACHDPNAEALTQITFPSGETVTPTEASTAVCGQCHQGRESGASQVAKITGGDTNIEDNGTYIPYSDNLTAYLDTPTCPEANDDETDNITDCTPITFRNVHYAAAAATLFGGLSKVAVEYEGVTYPGKSTHPVADCAGCHNNHSTAINVGRNGKNCTPCHEFTADQDFGTLPGQATVANALAALLAAIQEYAENNPDTPCIVYDGATYPYWFTDEDCDGTVGDNDTSYSAWTPRLVKAAYNYQVGLKDAGAWAHNKAYITTALGASVLDLVSSGFATE